MTGTWTPVLTCLNPGTLNFGYVNGIQTGLWALDENGYVTLDFTLFPRSIFIGSATGYLQITGIPYEIDQPINTIGTLNWRGFNKEGFTQFNVATRIGAHNDRLVLRCNQLGSNDGMVEATDLIAGTDTIDLCGSIRYRAGACLL